MAATKSKVAAVIPPAHAAWNTLLDVLAAMAAPPWHKVPRFSGLDQRRFWAANPRKQRERASPAASAARPVLRRSDLPELACGRRWPEGLSARVCVGSCQ